MAAASGRNEIKWGTRINAWSERADLRYTYANRNPHKYGPMPHQQRDYELAAVERAWKKKLLFLGLGPKLGNFARDVTEMVVELVHPAPFSPLEKEGPFVEHRALNYYQDDNALMIFGDISVKAMEDPKSKENCLVAHNMETGQVVWERGLGDNSFQRFSKGILLVDENEQDIELIDPLTATGVARGHKVHLPFPLHHQIHITEDDFVFYDAEDGDVVGGFIKEGKIDCQFKKRIHWSREAPDWNLRMQSPRPFGNYAVYNITTGWKTQKIFIDREGNSFEMEISDKCFKWHQGRIYLFTQTEEDGLPCDFEKLRPQNGSWRGDPKIYTFAVCSEKEFMDSGTKPKWDHTLRIRSDGYWEIKGVSNQSLFVEGYGDMGEFHMDLAKKTLVSTDFKPCFVDPLKEEAYHIENRGHMTRYQQLFTVYKWAKGKSQLMGDLEAYYPRLAYVDVRGIIHYITDSKQGRFPGECCEINPSKL